MLGGVEGSYKSVKNHPEFVQCEFFKHPVFIDELD